MGCIHTGQDDDFTISVVLLRQICVGKATLGVAHVNKDIHAHLGKFKPQACVLLSSFIQTLH